MIDEWFTEEFDNDPNDVLQLVGLDEAPYPAEWRKYIKLSPADVVHAGMLCAARGEGLLFVYETKGLRRKLQSALIMNLKRKAKIAGADMPCVSMHSLAQHDDWELLHLTISSKPSSQERTAYAIKQRALENQFAAIRSAPFKTRGM